MHETQSKLDDLKNNLPAEFQSRSLLLKSLENELQHLRTTHNVALTSLEQVSGALSSIMAKFNLLHLSTSWKLVRPLLSLMMNPRNLGMGESILDDIANDVVRFQNHHKEGASLDNLPGTQANTASVNFRNQNPSGDSLQQLKTNSMVSYLLGNTDHNVKVGFVVTEDSEAVGAGDYFTAMELASSLTQKFGWECSFLSELSQSRDWYDIQDLDCIVVMLDHYDLAKIHNQSKPLLKIAWARNWIDRWAVRSWIRQYDLFLCSSEIACNYIYEWAGVHAEVLRIATNIVRFHPDVQCSKDFVSDYCFTGNYWGADRQIEQIDPDNLPYEFALYGTGWDKHPQFKKCCRGHVLYNQLPKVYVSTSILIDDANHVTGLWGSVNSRVFDSLAAGTLVITNGVEGALETFGGLLPTYSSKAELEASLKHFLEHPGERQKLANELRHVVVEKHSYEYRAAEFREILSREFVNSKGRVAIKLPVPNANEAQQWGDFHFAKGLAKALRKLDYSVRLDFIPDWYRKRECADDVTITIRGLSRYVPENAHLNYIWLISHPAEIKFDELEEYDHVFVASEPYARSLNDCLETEVSALLQCTDPDRFKPVRNSINRKNIAFVGNSRKQLRPIVCDAISSGLGLEVIGKDWKGLIDDKFVVGELIENQLLGQFYSSCGVVLCDHWPDMQRYGFLSNRLFDVVASGTAIVSDDVVGIREVFGDLVRVYAGESDELRVQVEAALSEENASKEHRLRKAVEFVQHHSFDARAGVFDAYISMDLKLSNIRVS